MIFRKEFLAKIKAGDVTLAFRQWKKLSIKEGGTLKTSVGDIFFKSIKAIQLSQIKKADALKAGFSNLDSLLSDLSGEGIIYKIQFSLIGPDPRLALREKKKLTKAESEELVKKLQNLDSRGSMKNWVLPVMNFLATNPGVPSKIMAHEFGHDQMKLKLNVRKLKNLGLTISLGNGYKLSPLGKIALKLYARDIAK